MSAQLNIKDNFFIHQYFMHGKEFSGWKMPEVAVASPSVTQYVWHNKADRSQVFKVDVTEGSSVEDAKETYGELLQNNMRPLSELKKVEHLLGSDAYVSPAEEMSYGLFRVGNMVIRVHSVGHTTIACNEFIKKLYDLFNETPEVYQADNAQQAANVFSSQAGLQLRAGEKTILNMQAQVWYKLVLNGPGMLSVHNGRMEYISDERGNADIDLYTFSENAVTKHTLTLTVK